MILLIDNYDSFVFNLARYLRRLGAEVVVLRNDSTNVACVAQQAMSIVISPGPCGPDQAGECGRLVQQFSGVIPILGICLGHQIICQAFGGRIVRASRPIHGMSLPIQLSLSPLFQGLEPMGRFARYHSLIAESASLPNCLRVIAKSLPDLPGPVTADTDVDAMDQSAQIESQYSNFQQEIMAVEHCRHQTYGVQFHPESILSQGGYRLLSNFLAISGISSPNPLPTTDLVESTPVR